jgi:predicted CopG family antitoxin
MANISCTNSKKCTVLLKEKVYAQLKRRGRFGETFSDVVARLLNESEEIKQRDDSQ